MDKPLVSVIIPIYQVESFLPRCLDSVINQTYDNIEVICIDDGSSDRSGIICDEYAAKDSRIRVIHKKNEGVALARYDGVRCMNGEYATFVDPDDYISLNAIEIMVGEAVKCGVEIVAAQHYDNKDEVIIPFNNSALAGYYDREAIERMLKTNFLFDHTYGNDAICLTLWAKLFKKTCLEERLKEGVGYKISEDTICLFAIMKNIQSLYVIDDYIYYYVSHPLQITKCSKNLWWKYHVEAWKKIHSLDVDGFLHTQLPTKMLYDFYRGAVSSLVHEKSMTIFRKFAVDARNDNFVKRQLWDNQNVVAFEMSNRVLLYLMRWRCYIAIWLIGHYHILGYLKLMVNYIGRR